MRLVSNRTKNESLIRRDKGKVRIFEGRGCQNKPKKGRKAEKGRGRSVELNERGD